jgi:hypothetical protein
MGNKIKIFIKVLITLVILWLLWGDYLKKEDNGTGEQNS